MDENKSFLKNKITNRYLIFLLFNRSIGIYLYILYYLHIRHILVNKIVYAFFHGKHNMEINHLFHNTANRKKYN